MPRDSSYKRYSNESNHHSRHRDGSRSNYRSRHDILRSANILYCETTEDVMRRMMRIVEEERERSDSEAALIRNIKDHLDEVFGPTWNVFMADCRCWSLKTYKQGTNLVFEYRNMVYDIYQAPENGINVHTKGPGSYTMNKENVGKVKILYCEASDDAKRRILNIVDSAANKSDWGDNRIRAIKTNLDYNLGPKWNVFMADSRCWALKTYKQGTNIIFELGNMVYDIYQSADDIFENYSKVPNDYQMYN